MASTFFGLNIAKSGLYAHQIGINTATHNVANADTKGYTRQIVNKQASIPLSVGSRYGMVGTGVDVMSITQVRNQYLDEKFSFNTSISGEYTSKAYYMTEIGSYFNEITVQGFTKNFDNFYNTLHSLETNPSAGTTRTQAMTYASTVTEYLNSLGNNLMRIQEECNTEIKNIVDRINSIAAQISIITQQINSVETTAEHANDLRDQRALLVDELSQFVSVDAQELNVGEGVTKYTVKINGQTLVDTDIYNELELVPRKLQTNVNDVEGLYDIRWKNNTSFNALATNVSGSLKAILEVRDGNNGEALKGSVSGQKDGTTLTLKNTMINDICKLNIANEGKISIGIKEYEYTSFKVKLDADGNYEYEFTLKEPLEADIESGKVATIGEDIDYKGIPYYMSQLNEFVRVYAEKFNDVHKTGLDLDGNTGLDFFTCKNAIGTEFSFKTEKESSEKNTVLFDSSNPVDSHCYYSMNVMNIRVNSEILNDNRKLVTYSDKTAGVENTDILKKLIALKSDTSMFKQGSPASFFQTMVAEIGVNEKTANKLAENQQDIVESVTNQRLSVSGVDADEEAINLIKLQNCYNLSAKALSIMNEVLDTLINRTGL